MDAYIGMICLFPYTFAPRNWAYCNGQLISIAENSALFSLLGTTFGGDGVHTFALPDLRGRVVIGPGQGPGLTPHVQGEMSGAEHNTLLLPNLPAHSHSLLATEVPGNSPDPSGNLLANTGSFDSEYHSGPPNAVMSSQAIGMTGNNMPVNNMQPYLAIQSCICLYGIYPSRND
ncbi:phage tail protein [Arundinibacter roseus]|uniref:Phage tail protein n=1 Tax=Arundinibacter roseus TaxID=2070510 RepID=A0A4R4K8T2_9BACT|nr:tail fiber protein [Arundinibacter roseus]TDB64068.1 phage tail protein [Arundinibacter roseus]